jgi:DNA-binding response OmpR family regulator
MSLGSLAGCRILVVEDDFYQARDCREYLSAAGAQVTVTSGQNDQVMALIEASRFDAALLDVNLGQELSFDIARRLRDHEIPLLFLTGYDPDILPDDLASCALLIKPAGSIEVIERLASVMRHN